VPLLARGRTLGALTFAASESGRRYTTTDLALAEELATRAAKAIDNALLHEQTQRAVRGRQHILAIVSHDLRNPLNAILMNTALLLQDAPPHDRRNASRKRLEVVIRSVERMDRMIGDLMDQDAIDRGNLRIDKQRHALNGLVEEALESQQFSASTKSIRLVTELPIPEVQLLCDRERLLQVLANLVGNAVKFTPENGTITLRAQQDSREIRVSVIDTGPGISREHLSHVFERYWQAEETAARGTGLGLDISKGIIEAHGGAIWVESEVGGGTAFSFTLPSAPPSQASAP
jgi:signal transduction histidine kinase